MRTVILRKNLVVLFWAFGFLLVSPLVASPGNIVSSGPWLVFDLGMPHNVRVVYAGVDFQIEISTDGGESFETVFHKIYSGQAWLPCAVNLSPYNGQEVVLRALVDPVYGQGSDLFYHG